MTKLSSLIDPKVAAKMQAVVAKQPQPAAVDVPTCPCGAGAQGFTMIPGTNKVLYVHAECGLPTPKVAAMFPTHYREALANAGRIEALTVDLRPLSPADAIDIDPESEALIEAACVDCEASLLIEPKVPEGIDPDTPRVPICLSCAKERAKEAARKHRNVEIARRTTVAKHKPRVSDGIDHPVTVTNTKEDQPMFDLDNISPAKRAELVEKATERMRIEKADETKKARKKAKKQAKKEAERALAMKTQEQAARKAAKPLPEFVACIVKGEPLIVPALDLSDKVLEEMPSSKERSPYNKARFHLLGERALVTPKDVEDDASLAPTTYATLAQEHVRLREAAAIKAAQKQVDKAEAAPKKKGKKAKKREQVEVLIADLDPKVSALMDSLEVDESEALRILALIS